MNGEALVKVKTKRDTWKRYKTTRDERDYKVYTRARNQARWATRQAVKQFEKSIAKEVKSNPKAFWKYAQSTTRTRPDIADLNVDGRLTRTEKEKADVLNEFFTSVFTTEDTTDIPTIPPQALSTELRYYNFNEYVRKKLETLKVSKAAGPDGIHPRVLKKLKDIIHIPLNLLFHKSLNEHTLPTDWKTVHISPIFKKGDRHCPANYRPVCLTAVCCKVMESLLREELVSHMISNSLLSDHQHGFANGRSCMTNLLATIEDWSSELDEGGSVDAVYMDFMKAFDTVPPRTLWHQS